MTPPDGLPFSESNLESAEYRERLMRKLNCLIAVLEVANAKVRQSLSQPGGDQAKLARIKKNLQDTLDVCLRAKSSLERREPLPESVSQGLAKIVSSDVHAELEKSVGPKRARKGRKVEMSSAQELRKFARMGKIEPAMVWSCDLDDLARRFQQR